MKELISIAKLVTSPDMSATIGVWTDYCELLCLSEDNNCIDRDQMSSIVIKSDDFANAGERAQRMRKDKLSTKFQDVYTHVLLRKQVLGDNYPFDINEDDQLYLKPGELTCQEKLYIFLLYASNLEYMKSIHELTSDFEVVCLMYMRKLFPSMVFKLFGSSNSNTKLQTDDVINDVKLSDRIINLSKFTTVSLDPEGLSKIKKHNHGDGGLDLVGVRLMGDDRKSIPVIFGQCACSYDQWAAKQLSISDSKWKKYLRTWETSIQTYIFIPIWNMDSEKGFENDLELTHCVLVDRQRILYLADDSLVQNLTSI